jgi:hypothetical protein
MTDILLDENYEILFENGDFKVGDSEGQHIKLLLDTFKGDWTQNPTTGIGLIRWKNGRMDARFERECQLQFTADGLTDLKIKVINDTINIDKK